MDGINPEAFERASIRGSSLSTAPWEVKRVDYRFALF